MAANALVVRRFHVELCTSTLVTGLSPTVTMLSVIQINGSESPENPSSYMPHARKHSGNKAWIPMDFMTSVKMGAMN